jgi:metal transporter CNNM
MSGGGLQWRALARLSLLRVIVMPLASAIPRSVMVASDIDEDPGSTWLYLATAAFLVILGGAFSGLTIA